MKNKTYDEKYGFLFIDCGKNENLASGYLNILRLNFFCQKQGPSINEAKTSAICHFLEHAIT